MGRFGSPFRPNHTIMSTTISDKETEKICPNSKSIFAQINILALLIIVKSTKYIFALKFLTREN